MAIIAGQINPSLYALPDYSGVTRAAEMQVRNMANIGNQIAGSIDKYGDMKKEQKKVDALNKASAKSIDAAITLGESYGITDARKVLSPFLEAYNDPNLSPIEKAALLDEGKAMTGNLFGRYDKDQAYLIDQARIDASKQPATSKPLTLAEIAVGAGRQQAMLDPVTGIARPIIMQGFNQSGQGTSVLNNLPDTLKPFAKDFESAGTKYGVAPTLLAAISMHETGGGTSSAFRNKNNAMGVSDSAGPVQMGSVQESIERMASLLGKGINEGTGPYANVKTVDDIAKVYAPINAENDPRGLNQSWTQGVTSNLNRLMQSAPAQPSQVGFIPDEAKAPTGTRMTPAQVAALRTQGFEPSGIPLGNGDFYVTGTSPVKEKAPTGTVIPMSKYYEEVRNGQNIQGVPLGDGNFYVTGQQPFAPRKGQETIINKDGSVTIRDVALGEVAGDKAARAAEERGKQRESFVEEFTNTAIETIDMLPNLPDNPIGVKFAAMLGELVPASPEGRVVSRLNTLKANLALDKVNQLRAASPTGGSVGTMTVQEWPLFMQEFGSLEAAEDKRDLAKRLQNASIKLFNRVNGSPEDRAAALENGTITKSDNDAVEQQYQKMLSNLGIIKAPAPASAGTDPYNLAPNIQNIEKDFERRTAEREKAKANQ